MDIAGPSSLNALPTDVTVNDLPKEILHKVFSHLNCEDLISVSKVCSIWNVAVNYVGLWNDVLWTIPESAEPIEIESIVKYIPTLRNIKYAMGGTEFVCGDTILKQIIKHCNAIRSLHTGRTCAIHTDVFKSIISKFPNIEDLKIGFLATEDQDILKPIQSCLNLKMLEIRCTEPGVILHPLAVGCPELTHLNIQDLRPTAIDFADFLLAKKDKIQSLVFSAPPDDAFTIPLRECKNLEHVHCTFVIDKTITKEVLAAIASLPELTRLDLIFRYPITSCIVSEFFCSVLSRNVVELSLVLYRKMTIEEAAAIRTCCPLVKRLRLKKCLGPLGDEVPPFTSLFQLPHLEHLELVSFTYSESWFSQLLKCQTLRLLKLISCSSLESHAALLLLTNLNLVYLDLSYCRNLNNSFLTNFPRSVFLKQLKILECGFSKRRVEQLKLRHPSIVIN